MKSIFYQFSLVFALLVCAVIEAKAQAPAPPVNLTATSETISKIRLRWQDQANNETSFVIERAKDTDDNFVQVATVGRDTLEYLDDQLIAETTYFYRVKAVNNVGSSVYSNTIGAATAPVTSTAEEKLQKLLVVYPVPTQQYIVVDLQQTQRTGFYYCLFSLQGKLLLRGKFHKKLTISLGNYPRGTYFLKVKHEKYAVTKQLIKE